MVSHNPNEITKLAQNSLFLNNGVIDPNQENLPFLNRLLIKPLFEDENYCHYEVIPQTISLPKDCLNPTFKLDFNQGKNFRNIFIFLLKPSYFSKNANFMPPF
ncbi:hypothetical protein VN1226_02310 [Helicobacter pylori]|nr:hypothetical protein VN1226_02310 [Helicobacter pylori]